jgi:hypothetical protein
MPAVEALAPVDRRVQELGLLAVAGVHRVEAADLVPEPPCHQHEHVDREHGRGVVERAAVHVCAVVEHRRQSEGDALQQVLAQEHDGDTRRAGVLLGSTVQEPVALDRDGPGQEIR